MVIVSIVGTLVIGVGATALYFVFRGFGGAKPVGRTHVALIAGLLAFVFACCLALFALSYR
ncbi:MAG TPA: hypothetical protein VHL59_08115 [Thermoanaerobaculia bacterium]|nr:hypothetical protein [Thermoanaerobaculia bacterium]